MGLFCLKHKIAPFPDGMDDCPVCLEVAEARRAGYEQAREQVIAIFNGSWSSDEDDQAIKEADERARKGR